MKDALLDRSRELPAAKRWLGGPVDGGEERAVGAAHGGELPEHRRDLRRRQRRHAAGEVVAEAHPHRAVPHLAAR